MTATPSHAQQKAAFASIGESLRYLIKSHLAYIFNCLKDRAGHFMGL